LIENKDKLAKSKIDPDSTSELTVGLAAIGVPIITEDIISSKDESDEGAGGFDDFGGGGDMDFGDEEISDDIDEEIGE